MLANKERIKVPDALLFLWEVRFQLLIAESFLQFLRH